MNKRKSIKIIVSVASIAIILSIFYFTIPVKRVNILSQLIMLGDLNDDKMWNDKDKELLQVFIENPFSYDRINSIKVDINKNGFIDKEDIDILFHLYKHSDPYEAQRTYTETNRIFPRPRELFRYVPTTEYMQRPLYLLENTICDSSPLNFINKINRKKSMQYDELLMAEIYNESLRFTFAFNKRFNSLTDFERIYVKQKIDYCNTLYQERNYYDLLLNLISLVEDAETLTIQGQTRFINNILFFRNHLRELLISPLYKDYLQGDVSYNSIYINIETFLKADLNIDIKLGELKPPRDFLKLSNFIDRSIWQYYKSTSTKKDISKLSLFAQYDRRYLRSVAKTSPSHIDIQLQNHNLPMILLFREALRIKSGNKKSAVGMIDESIRIPFAWIKLIPKNKLPSSIALENFLLPGNKEDGSDKSRHWNVFGGISLYKSPEESLILSIKREISDFTKSNYSKESMTEFIRDTIANINGIYHVVAINPKLIYENDL